MTSIFFGIVIISHFDLTIFLWEAATSHFTVSQSLFLLPFSAIRNRFSNSTLKKRPPSGHGAIADWIFPFFLVHDILKTPFCQVPLEEITPEKRYHIWQRNRCPASSGRWRSWNVSWTTPR